MNDLKKVYRAASREIAENYLLELEEKWGEKYPLVLAEQLGKFVQLFQIFWAS
ncbi:IS256 family transposase [Wolbachia endosymbiont of Armadillidium vulgare str. wVulC]|nr:IS256 family transposase [Wolbachia endosymbiont of Armadillidium vulgare str. wVulC]OJH30859.1 hypothetical protein Wxf_00222 [Wolbachia endosymbiont of Armadillidium vulgare]